jgi:hypothetical protein
MKYNEKRAFLRIDLDSEMQYRVIDSSEFQPAQCTSLSGSGVSFITSICCNERDALEIQITPQNAITPAFTAFIEVVRIAPLTAGKYEIAATIKTIKG